LAPGGELGDVFCQRAELRVDVVGGVDQDLAVEWTGGS
jgi:hypothetical protein